MFTGIIKGMIPKEWIPYTLPLKDVRIADQIIRKGLGYINGDQLLLNAEKLYAAKQDYLDPITLQAVLLMYRQLDAYLIQNPLLDLDIYLNLDEQYCTFEPSKRRGLYEIATSYQVFLEREGKVDENDLARLFLQKITQEQVKPFDFVVADEIQDLTEIQIYTLIRLARNPNHLLFSGDINQTIRPTYFHMGRIESILKTSNAHLKFRKYPLTRNYRSPREVVDLANQIIDLRIERLGLNKSNDYYEAPVRGRHSDVFFCDFQSSKDLANLLETGLNRHYVAIVVPDEIHMEQLKHFTNTEGAVFTVEEIKGIEKDYIIGYNVMSKYMDIWETILHEDVAHDSKYRYYFNLLYVAVTRARQQLCLIEEAMPPSLMNKLADHFVVG